MRVEVHNGDRAVHGGERAQQRQRDRVVAAQGQQVRHPVEQVTRTALDRRDRLVDAERVDREIAGVGDLQAANGDTLSAGLYGRSSLEDSLMCEGPNLAPGR